MPRSSLSHRVLPPLGLLAGALLIAATVQRGPGLGAYLPWAAALLQGTPAPLDNTITLSPTGFPLFHWYPGTGLFLALPTFVSGGALPLGPAARLAAALAIVLTLACCAAVLYEIAGQRVGLLCLGMALLLVATNTGYYIRLLGAELFALAVVASLIGLAWLPPKLGHVELVGVSALAGLLLTVRPQASLMAAPALVLGLLRWASGRRRAQLAWAGLYGGVPVALGLLVVLQVNHWMTGEWTHSPYSFGNDQFQSVTLSAPYLRLVLFDPSAGLLRCTPFIALGLCAALVPILDRRLETAYRVFYLVALLAGLAQIWLIACSYSWAGGAWIFGSRYLNLLSLYSVMATVQVLACERVAWALHAVVLSVAVACAAYTARVLGLPYPLLGALAVGATAAAGLAVATPRPRHRLPDRTYGGVGLTLLGLMLYYYAWCARAQGAATLPPPALLWAGAAAVGIVLAVAVRGSAFPPAWAAAKSLALGAVVTLVIGGSLVARLRVGAAAFQARELASPSPHFLYRNRFDVRNLEADLKQETVYKWPEEVKHAIRSFLEEEKRRTAIPRPADRRPAI
jgi:hypothetical protein